MLEEAQKEKKRYLRVYQSYKEAIESGHLQPGVRMPSIRTGAGLHQVSRTTMEAAYLMLAAEGYIRSKPQSGYYVTDIASERRRKREQKVEAVKKKPKIHFDFAATGVDPNSFQFDLWRRYVKSALRQDKRLLSYGEPQGELEFREVLCTYLMEKRHVFCSPEQIVIGAGFQSLLHILCPLIRDYGKVMLSQNEFQQAKVVFEDYGFEMTDQKEDSKLGIYYVTPSQMTGWGKVMSNAERKQLLEFADQRQILLIEDDYNNEFRYSQKSISSLQGMAGGKGVVYMGTFSKWLLPSIRMSFLVLPEELLEAYKKRGQYYNQTASKAEQIAITQYIRDGHLERQVKKSRKIYQQKEEAFLQAARNQMQGALAEAKGEMGTVVSLVIRTNLSVENAKKKLLEQGIQVVKMRQEQGRISLDFSLTNVSATQYPQAMEMLWNILCEKEDQPEIR